MRKSLRKNSKEVKGLFEKNIKCTQVRSEVGLAPRDVISEIVKFDLSLESSSIVRGIKDKRYCVYSGNDVYDIEVID